MIGAVDLQQAIFIVLSNDNELSSLMGGVRLYDTPPRNAQFPYLSFGPLSSVDWSTSEDIGAAYTVTLNCWSDKKNRKQAQTIAERASDLLTAPIEMAASSNVHLALLHPIGSQTQNNTQRSIIRSTLRFRAIVEAAD